MNVLFWFMYLHATLKRITVSCLYENISIRFYVKCLALMLKVKIRKKYGNISVLSILQFCLLLKNKNSLPWAALIHRLGTTSILKAKMSCAWFGAKPPVFSSTCQYLICFPGESQLASEDCFLFFQFYLVRTDLLTFHNYYEIKQENHYTIGHIP